MRSNLACLTVTAMLVCLFTGAVSSIAAEPKFEAQLIWGTNDKHSPNPDHKPVEAAVKKRLSELPLKFTNYFEVNRKSFNLPASGTRKVELSDKCGIQVARKGDEAVQVSLLGKGAEVAKRTQPMPKGEVLVLGGNAPNETAWLVVLKRLD